MLHGNNAVSFACGGAVGSKVARVFAREGARVFLSGRRLALVAAVAEQINACAEAAEVMAFLASDWASAVTATVANLPLGQVVG